MITLKSIIAAAISLLVISGPAYAMPIDPLGPIVNSTNVQDLRSPDAREGTVPESRKPFVAIDMRTPDAREVPASKPSTTFVAADVRSPDAVTGTGTGNPHVVVVDAPKPVLADDFDWSDAARGAAILALGLLAMGAAYIVVKHRPLPLG